MASSSSGTPIRPGTIGDLKQTCTAVLALREVSGDTSGAHAEAVTWAIRRLLEPFYRVNQMLSQEVGDTIYNLGRYMGPNACNKMTVSPSRHHTLSDWMKCWEDETPWVIPDLLSGMNLDSKTFKMPNNG